MTQNIYDDPAFFTAYSGLRRSLEGLDGAPEWPAMRALLPQIEGARVLDLGCGFGWFSRWAREAGAAQVTGVDVSANMLARARADTADQAIVFQQADLETYAPPSASFDLIYSSLALHYVSDLAGLISRIAAGLVAGGRLVVSVEHPIYTAPWRPGWTTNEDGGRTWPIDRYNLEGPRITDWLAPGVVKYHRMLGTWLNRLIAAGLRVDHVEDWGPTDALLDARPDLASERDRPMFLIIAASLR
jgi:SAM-dependent methyltransferase